KEQEPNFVPEDEQSYGLYAHESFNLPQSSVTSNNNNVDDNFLNNAKYLPKNYNPVAYVTEPEDFNEDSTFSEKAYTNTPMNNNHNYENNEANNYYNAQQQQNVKDFDFMDKDDDSSRTNNRNYNNYYKDASFSTNPSSNNNNYNRFGGRVNRVQPQGMSDTRFLENGRYYYDINSEKYSVHPNDNAMAMRNQYHPRGSYGNHNANSYQYNNFNDAQDQYQDDDNMP
ncbi:hypothetical protein Leryth_018383, partial [Lithospermum erythrorhizon]